MTIFQLQNLETNDITRAKAFIDLHFCEEMERERKRDKSTVTQIGGRKREHKLDTEERSPRELGHVNRGFIEICSSNLKSLLIDLVFKSYVVDCLTFVVA